MSEALRLAAWRVILWQQRADCGFHPTEPGLSLLIHELMAEAGECPADVSKRLTPLESIRELAQIIGPDLVNVTEEDIRRIRSGEDI